MDHYEMLRIPCREILECLNEDDPTFKWSCQGGNLRLAGFSEVKWLACTEMDLKSLFFKHSKKN